MEMQTEMETAETMQSNPEEKRQNAQEYLRDGERLDDLQRDGYQIIQNPRLFCFGMDAVLLSSFAVVKPGEKVLDLCSGNGVIPILLKAKSRGKTFSGLEINEMNVDMARRSALLNGIEDSVKVVQGDIKEADRIFPAASFDVVTCNPPYMTGGRGLLNEKSDRAIARHELLCTFEDVAHSAQRMLRPGGRFYLVHRPSRLPQIIRNLCACGLEPKRMRLVYPFSDKEANMVLIESARGGRPEMKLEKPLIIYRSHDGSGVYTDEVREMYNMQKMKEHEETALTCRK